MAVELSTLLLKVDGTAAQKSLKDFASAASATGVEGTRMGKAYEGAAKAMAAEAAKLQKSFRDQESAMKASGATQAELAAQQYKNVESMRSLVKVYEDGKKLMEEHEAPQEKYARRLAEINEMHQKGAIDTRTHAVELAKMQSEMMGGVATAGKYMSAVTAAFAAAGVAVVALAVKTGEYASKLDSLKQTTGLSTDAIQEFEHVARSAGVSSDGFLNTIQRLNSQIPEISAGTGAAATALDKLGISIMGANGQTRDMNELFPKIINQLQSMENITERNAVASDIFGRSLTDVAPILGMSATEMAKLRKEAHDTGRVMGGDALKSANDLRIGVDDLKSQMASMGRGIASEVIPVLNDTLIPFIQSTAIPAVKTMADAAGTLIKVFGAAPPVLQGAVVGIGGLTAAAGPAALGLVAIVKAKQQILVLAPQVTAGLKMVGTAMKTAFPLAALAAAVAALGMMELKTRELNKETKRLNEETARMSAATTELYNQTKAAKSAVAEYEKLRGTTKFVAEEYDNLRKKHEDATIALKNHAREMNGKAAMDEMEVENTRRRMRGEEELVATKQKTEAQLAKEAEALKKANDKAQEYWNKMRSDGAAVYEAMMTPMEKYGAELKRLDTLKKAGVITQETYNRATLFAADALDATREKLLSSLDTENEAIARSYKARTVEIKTALKQQIIDADEYDKLMAAAGKEQQSAIDELDKKRKTSHDSLASVLLSEEQKIKQSYDNRVAEIQTALGKGTIIEQEYRDIIAKMDADEAKRKSDSVNKLMEVTKSEEELLVAKYERQRALVQENELLNEQQRAEIIYAERERLQENLEKLNARQIENERKLLKESGDLTAAHYAAASESMSAINALQSALFGSLTTISREAYSEMSADQQAAYDAQFAVTKAFAIATATLNTLAATASAMATQPFFPAGLAAWAKAATGAAEIISGLMTVKFTGARDRGGTIGADEFALAAERRPEFINGDLLTEPAMVRGPARITSGAETERVLAGSAQSGGGGASEAPAPAPVQESTFVFNDSSGGQVETFRRYVRSGEMNQVISEMVQAAKRMGAL